MKKSEIHILLIDDDESIRKVFSELISKSGYKVSAVGTAAEAENVVKLKKIHLAIIDCMLPVINGVDLAKKMLNSSLKNTPVILISGIFRDDQFAEEALKKSGADEFFTKPIDSTSFMEKVSELVGSLVDAKAGSLESLLTKTELSRRDARKTLDVLENISGYDFMMVLSVLMRGKSSGYLNVTNPNGELVGFTIKNGDLVDVDTLKDPRQLTDLLMQKKLMDKSEAKSIMEKAGKRDPLGYMVTENFISPHMEKMIRSDKIFEDLKKILSNSTLDVNFNENRSLEDYESSVNLTSIDGIFFESIKNKIPLEWFKDFYENWMANVIHLAKNFDGNRSLTQLGSSKELTSFIERMKSGANLGELCEEFGEKLAYPTMHYLIVSRLVCFASETKLKNLSEQQERLDKMLQKIEGKNPLEVFRFFGAGENPPPLEVERIYKEFAKSNHPDKLPATASVELQNLNNKVFSIVSEAHDILVDPEKRMALVNKIKENEAKNQIKAESLMEKAIPLLERAKYQDAYLPLMEAYSDYQSHTLFLYLTWARVKVEPNKVKSELGKLKDHLKDFSTDEKKSALYYFVSGLLAAQEADYTNSERFFNRALEYNKNFLPARRELAVLKSGPKSSKSKTTDFLNGDVSTIISGLFKKKSG